MTRRAYLDVTWRRANLPAGLIVVVAMAAMLTATLLQRGSDALRATHAPDDVSIPIDDARAHQAVLRLDPNTATAAQMQLLPEIGPITAQKIVATRQAQQREGIDRPFLRQSDLTKVPGIGPKTVRRMAVHLDLPE